MVDVVAALFLMPNKSFESEIITSWQDLKSSSNFVVFLPFARFFLWRKYRPNYFDKIKQLDGARKLLEVFTPRETALFF